MSNIWSYSSKSNHLQGCRIRTVKTAHWYSSTPPLRQDLKQPSSYRFQKFWTFWDLSVHIAMFFLYYKNLVTIYTFPIFGDSELRRGHNMIVWSRRCQKLNIHNHTLPRKKHRAKNIILSWRKFDFKKFIFFVFHKKKDCQTFWRVQKWWDCCVAFLCFQLK